MRTIHTKASLSALLGLVSIVSSCLVLVAFAGRTSQPVEPDNVQLQMDSNGLYHVVGVPLADW